MILREVARARTGFASWYTCGQTGVAKHLGYRGYCYRSLGRLQEALKDYNEAIRLSDTATQGKNAAKDARAAADAETPGVTNNAQYYYERALV